MDVQSRPKIHNLYQPRTSTAKCKAPETGYLSINQKKPSWNRIIITMPKERTPNPATAALKSQKQATIKKQKAQIAAQRTARLANRNPERLQKQIDELVATKEAQGGKLRPKDQSVLEGLERDVRIVKKAREADPNYGRDKGRDGDAGVLGKRRREDGAKHMSGQRDGRSAREHGAGHRGDHRRRQYSSEPDTDPEVRDIPMPRDTPPPIPPRRPRDSDVNSGGGRGLPSQADAFRARKPFANLAGDHNSNMTNNASSSAPPPRPRPQAKTEYSSAPVIRDLRKEAVDRFMPAAVAAKAKAAKEKKDAKEGKVLGKLLEPEELDKLEAATKVSAAKASNGTGQEGFDVAATPKGGRDADLDDENAMLRELEEEERRFRHENEHSGTQETNDAMETGEEVRGIADEMEKEAQFKAMAVSHDTHALPADRSFKAAGGGLVDYGDSDSSDEEVGVHGGGAGAQTAMDAALYQVEMEEVEDEDG